MPFKKKNIDNIGPLTPEEQQVILDEAKIDVDQVDTKGVDPLEVDDSLNDLAQLAEAVKKQTDQNTADNAMSSMGAEIYKPGGNVKVTASTDKKAYGGKGPLTARQREELILRLQARTATDADLAQIDESMVMELPFIKALDYSIPNQYDPKPRDPSIRFRWVNCVNYVQGNLMRLKALGYETASIDDINTDLTPVHESSIKGTEIHQYDTVLMKIHVYRLMALYRKNIETSLFQLDSVTSGRISEAAANGAFQSLISGEPGAVGALNKTRVATGREPVTFQRT